MKHEQDCPVCGGEKQVVIPAYAGNGYHYEKCPTCLGTGTLPVTAADDLSATSNES